VVVAELETVMVKDASSAMLVEAGVDEVTDGGEVGAEPVVAVVVIEEFAAVVGAEEVVAAV